MGEFLERDYLIKVCGVTSVADAQVVADAGASALGVILSESPRRVDLDHARSIIDSVRGRLARVAVLRDSDDAEVERVLEYLDVEALQIHGQVPSSTVTGARARGVALVQALSVGRLEFAGEADAYLVDGPQPGSGQVHGWDDVAERHWTRPLIAAGGLDATNVAPTLARLSAWGCDAASGTEASPGRKDPARVASFVRAARDYFETRGESGG